MKTFVLLKEILGRVRLLTLVALEYFRRLFTAPRLFMIAVGGI